MQISNDTDVNESIIQKSIIKNCFERGNKIVITNYFPPKYRECDVLSITGSLYSYEYEIKTTKADFKVEFKNKNDKHSNLSNGGRFFDDGFLPNHFYFVSPPGIITESDLPVYAGLIYHIDYNNIRLIKKAPKINKEKVKKETLISIAEAYTQRSFVEYKEVVMANMKYYHSN